MVQRTEYRFLSREPLWSRSSVALPLGINGRRHPAFEKPPEQKIYRSAAPSERRYMGVKAANKRRYASPPPGVATHCATLRVAKARPNSPPVRPRRASPAPLKRRCARGRRPKGRKSTALVFAQSTAPCPPHCDSAFAPPLVAFFPRALGDSTVARRDFISILLIAKRVKSLFRRAGDGRASNRTGLPCAGSGRVTSAGQSDTAYRLLGCCTPFSVRAPWAIHSVLAHRRNS